MKRNRKIILLVILLLAGGFLLLRNFILMKNVDPQAKLLQAQLKKQASDQQKTTIDFYAADSNSLMAKLEDVTQRGSSGRGYLLRKNNLLKHAVIANLPDPNEGDFYEGWLVQQKPLKFISSGIMHKDALGSYILNLESPDLYEGYDYIVITLEKEKDAKPEEHILEGLAKKF